MTDKIQTFRTAAIWSLLSSSCALGTLLLFSFSRPHQVLGQDARALQLTGTLSHPEVQLTTIEVVCFFPPTIEVGPGLETFFSSFSTFPPLLPSLWPPRPLESKVIQIQSDHPLAASPPVAAMERSKVTCSIQVCRRKLGPHQEGLLWPSHEVHWIPCWLGSCFSSSLMLLFYTDDLLTFETDKSTW